MEEITLEHFTLNSKIRNNDLHIQLTGIFDADSAYALKSMFNSHYTQGGRFFLDLGSLVNLEPRQQLQFKKLLGELTIPPQKIFLKGKQALGIAYDGVRILLMKSKKCACVKPCLDCSCKKRMQQRFRNLHNKILIST